VKAAHPLALALVSLLAAVHCSDVEPASGADLCDEAGFSISNRTFACSQDQTLSNDRYERLKAGYDCKAAGPPIHYTDTQVECARSLLAMTCEQVTAAGDDLDRWLHDIPQCAKMFARKDGKSLDPPDPCLPLTTCNGACVDINTSADNCGGCGLVCPGAQRNCINRECNF